MRRKAGVKAHLLKLSHLDRLVEPFKLNETDLIEV